MSSSVVDTEPQSPPAKKAKTEPVASSASATATAAAFDPDMLAAAMAEGEKKFAVLKAELKKNFVSMAEELEALKDRMAEVHEAIRDRIAEQHDRLNHLTEAFVPATQHALFETAIYEFVDKKIPNGWKEKEGSIKHGIASLCSGVMDRLLSTDSEKKKLLTFHGGSTNQKSGNLGRFFL